MEGLTQFTVRVHFSDKSAPKTYEIQSHRFTIGRSFQAEVRLTGQGVSRQHLVVWIEAGQIKIKDNGSSSGVLLNGKRLPTNEPTAYTPGEKIQLGGADAVVMIEAKTFEAEPLECTQEAEGPSFNPVRQTEEVSELLELGGKADQSRGREDSLFIPDENGSLNSATSLKEALEGQATELVDKAEKQAETLLEKAQKEVDECLKEGEEKRRKIIDEGIEQARIQGEAEIKKAQRRADEMIQDTARECEEIRDRTLQEANELRELTQRKSEGMLAKVVEQAEIRKTRFQEELGELETQREGLSSEVASLQKETETLETEKEKRTRENEVILEEHRDAIQSLLKEKQALLISRNDILRENDRRVTEHEKRLHEIQYEGQQADAKFQKTLAQHKQLKAEIETLKGDCDQARKQAKTIVDEAEVERARLTKEIDQRQLQAIRSVEDAEKEGKKILAAAQSQLSALQGEIEGAQKRKEAERIGLITLREETDELLNQKKSLLDENHEITQRQERLKSEFRKNRADLQQEVDTLRLDLNKITADYQETRLLFEGMEAEREGIVEKIESAKKEQEDSEKRRLEREKKERQAIESLEQKKRALEEDCLHLKNQSESGTREVERLEKDKEKRLADMARTKVENEYELKERAAQAQKNADEIRAAAEKEGEAIKERARVEGEAYRKSVEDSLQETKASAERISQAGKEAAENLVTQAEAEIVERRKEADLQFRAQRKEVQEQLAAERLKEIERLKQIREKEARHLKRRRSHEAEEVSKNLDLAFRIRAKKVWSEEANEERLDRFLEEIQGVVHKIMLDDSSGIDEKIKTVMDTGETSEKNTKRYWKKVRIFATAAVIGVMLLVQLPFLMELFKGSPKEEKKATALDLYLEKRKKEQAQNQFVPQKTPGYKSAYVDNVLFTPNYVETKLNQKNKDKWIVELNRYFLDILDLKENTIVQFITIETRLVNELNERTKKLKVTTKDQEIEEMRALEKKAQSEIRTLLKTDKNYKKWKRFQAKFYRSLPSNRDLAEGEKTAP